MNIRPITADDIAQVAALTGNTPPIDDFRESGGEFWVAENGTRTVGTVAVRMLSNTTAELKLIYFPKDEFEDLPGKLIDNVINFAKETGALEIILWSEKESGKIHEIYRNAGFVLSAERGTELGFRKDLSWIAENSFEDACKQFQNFLSNNDLPTELLWAFKEDTYSRNIEPLEDHFWIKMPLLYENDDLIKEMYEQARKRGSAIGFHAYALCENGICCGLEISESDGKAERLKFSFRKDPPIAAPVKVPMKWAMFSLFPRKYKHGNFFAYLPSKENLQFPRD
jgi:hypothetical protein